MKFYSTLNSSMFIFLLTFACDSKISVTLNGGNKGSQKTTATDVSDADKPVTISIKQGSVTVPAGSYAPAADVSLEVVAGENFLAAVKLPTTTVISGGPMAYSSVLAGTSTVVNPVNPITVRLYVDADTSLGSDGAAIIVVTAANGSTKSFYVDHASLSVKNDTVGRRRYVDIGVVKSGSFSVALVSGLSSAELAASYATLPSDGNVTAEIPTVAIGAPSAVYAKTGDSVDFGVTYTGAKTINLTADDITIGGAATATKTVLNGTTATPTVRVTGFSGDGALTISVAAGKSSNAKLGVDLGAGPSAVVTVDNTLPLTPSVSPSSATYNGTRSMTFAQNSTVDATFKEFRYTTNGTAPTSCSDGTASSTSYTAAGTATQTIKIVACDQLGHMSSSSASATLTYDVTAPTLIVSGPSASSAISTATITYTVTYTGADTITLAASNVTLNTTGGASASKAVSCSSATCTVTLTSLTGNGTIGISLAAGTASDLAGNESLAAGPSATFTVDATAPTVSSVSSSTADGSYKAAQVIAVTVTFSEAVTVTGTPQITLATTATPAVVDYSSGSGTSTLTFSYTVAANKTATDLDYSATNSLALNSGTIKDASGNNATLTLATPGAANSLGANRNIVIDTTVPTVAFSSVSAGNPGSTLTPTILGTGSETSTVTLYFDSGCVTATSAGTANTTFASPGILLTTNVGTNTATVIYGKTVDTAGNASDCTSLVTYTHDSTAPTVSSVSSSTANATKMIGDTVAVTVTFSEAVTVTGSLQITLETGTTDAVVNYSSGSPGSTLTFTYTVATGNTNTHLDYVATTSLALTSGTIKDAAGNNATLTLPVPGATYSLGANKSFSIDGVVPTITYTSISPTSPGASQTPVVTLSLSEASGTSGLGLYSNSGCTTSIATAVTGASGSNAVTTTTLTSGSTTAIYAKATDVAGNVSDCTSMVSYIHTAGGGGGGGNSWTATTTTSAPGIRYDHTAVWTGSKMIVWGGNSGTDLNDGGRYDPVTNSWTATSATLAPTARRQHTAVWTGSKMIVWGGNNVSTPVNTGGLYDPVTDVWTATTSTGAPVGRSGHVAVWTGSVMIVWGATVGGGSTETGSRYDPVADTWTAMATTQPTYPSSTGSWTNTETRSGQSAVWTGSKMIVFGGQDAGVVNMGSVGCTNVGGVYDPAANTWTATTSTNAPGVRSFHSAIWTGSKMVVWGGRSAAGSGGNTTVNTGSGYDPVADTWTATTIANVPEPRSNSSAIWTGAKMVVWGGGASSNAGALQSGAEYDPVADSWAATTTTSAPAVREGHTAVWTGGQMIIWGGYPASAAYLNTGGVYTPRCSSDGVSIGGHCWYASGLGASCSTKCTALSLTYNTATLTYAGSSGTLAQCKAVLDAVFVGNYTVTQNISTPCGSSGVGCGVDSASDYKRCITIATTDTGSSGVFNRVCACQ